MEPQENTPESSGESAPGGLQDIVLNLDFVPAWARSTAGANPYADHDGGERREPRRDFGRGGRDDRGPRRDDRRGPPRDGARGPRRDGPPRGDRRDGPPRGGPGGAPRGDRRDGPRGGGRPDDRRFDERRGEGRRGPRRDFAPRLPVNVVFIPERKFLGAVVKDIREKNRAFPLAMLAGLFLKDPEHHMVKFEAKGGNNQPPPLKFWQNTKTGMIFLKRETALGYAIGHDLEEFFERKEIAGEAPKGSFVCVGRCSLSGELLGPPNFHGYNEKLMELYRTRFSGMPLDVYRSKVEIVRDPAVVEQWKEQATKTVRFREKSSPPETEATLKRAEAEFIFSEKYVKNLFKEGARFLVPGARARELPDAELRNLVRDKWTTENRFPLTLLYALRAAFSAMKLELFKVGRETFVSAIAPKPITVEHTVESIQKMLAVLGEHPGMNRKKLVEHFLPGTDPESDAGKELLSPLRWLIEKGHVIEYFNGTFALPSPNMVKQPKQSGEKKTETAAADSAPVASEEAAAEAEAAREAEATVAEIVTAETVEVAAVDIAAEAGVDEAAPAEAAPAEAASAETSEAPAT